MAECRQKAAELINAEEIKNVIANSTTPSPPKPEPPLSLSSLSPPSSKDPFSRSLVSNPDIVHKILIAKSITDVSLQENGRRARTPFFNEEVMEEGVESTVRRAFWDIVSSDLEEKNFTSFVDGVDALQNKVADLVSSRDDLRAKILVDPEVSSLADCAASLVSVAQILSTFESVERATSTDKWLEEETIASNSNMLPSFLVTSLQFLIKKADLCAADLVDAKLRAIAPFVRANGATYEKSFFSKAYGANGENALGAIEFARSLRAEEGRGGEGGEELENR